MIGRNFELLSIKLLKKGTTDPLEPTTLPYRTTEKTESESPNKLFAATNNLSEASFDAPYKLIGFAALSVDKAITFFTEQFIIATVDAALVAQNIVVASESAGLGICYIGALRNNPSEVSTVLDLPHDTYPVFGLCLGWPDQDPEVKPRLPIDVVLRENSYGIGEDGLNLGNYDEAVRGYYATRSSNQKSMSWSEQMSGMLSKESRPHMLDFLKTKGFLKK